MKTLHQKFDPARDEQAALWAARLEGSSLSAANRDALGAWLSEHPDNRPLLTQYCQFSADLEQQLPALLATGAITMPSENTRTNRRRVIWVATTALAAAIAVLVIWLGSPSRHYERIATAAGQRQSVTLADGTRVELNARTNLVVEHGRTERRVRLADGEAYFVVSKDKTRPFIVDTPSGSVQVTGTTFDVRNEVSGLDVTVVEGSVKVRPAGSTGASAGTPILLTAGNRLSRGMVQTLSRSALDDMLAWRQGQIVFDGVPLRDALAEFAHYHGCVITVSAAAANLNVGSRYSLDDLDGFFEAIEQSFHVTVSHDPGGNIHVSLHNEPLNR